MKALLTLALTAALAAPIAAQVQDQPQQQDQQRQQEMQQPQTGAERQDLEQQDQSQIDMQRQSQDPGTTGTAGQFDADQRELPATGSSFPLMALAGLASLAGAWAVRRFSL